MSTRRASWSGPDAALPPSKNGLFAEAEDRPNIALKPLVMPPVASEAMEEEVPAPVHLTEESGGVVLSKDCLSVVFANLSPMGLWSASLVSQLWRRVALMTWSKTNNKNDLTEWLRRQAQDHYLPYRRLSYYDRDYETFGLTMTWPKRPLRIYNVFRTRIEAVDERFALERLQELFGNNALWMNWNQQYRAKSDDAQVVWEGHTVHMRVEIEGILAEQFSRCASGMGPHECALIWGTGDNAAWAEKTCEDVLGWNRKKPLYQKDFGGGTANTLITQKVALVRSYGALTVGQIMHLVRGDLPECFPSLEEFEAVLPQSFIDKSRANYEEFLKHAKNGGVGTDGAQPAEPRPVQVPQPASQPSALSTWFRNLTKPKARFVD